MHYQLAISGVIERNQIPLAVAVESGFEWEVSEVSHHLVNGRKNGNQVVQQENTRNEQMQDHEDGEGGLAVASIIVWEVTHHRTEQRPETQHKRPKITVIHVNEKSLKDTAHNGHVAQQNNHEVESVDHHTE